MDKKWCVYGIGNEWIGYGKIIERGNLSIKILSNEATSKSIIWSDRNYFVKKFDTLEEMVTEFFKNGNTKLLTEDEELDKARKLFPSYFNRK